MRRVTSFPDCCQQSTVDVDSRLATSLRSGRTRVTLRAATTVGASPKESRMAPRRTAVITGSALHDAGIGLESRWASTVAASPLPRLAGAEKSLACNELCRLSKDRPPLPRALYGERSECNDQPQRSGYVEQARVDSGSVKWWVGSRFLLRARRGNEADRPRARPILVVPLQAAPSSAAPALREPSASELPNREPLFRHLYNRALDPRQLHSADHPAVRTLIPRCTSHRGP